MSTKSRNNYKNNTAKNVEQIKYTCSQKIRLRSQKMTNSRSINTRGRKIQPKCIQWKHSYESTEIGQNKYFHIQMISPFLVLQKNLSCLRLIIIHGGGTEIRTQGDLRHDSFQDCCIKPLCHPSVKCACILKKSLTLSKKYFYVPFLSGPCRVRK